MSKLFDKLVSLYRMVTPDQNAVADLCLSDTATLALVEELLRHDPDDTGLAILTGDPERLTLGQTVRLKFNLPRLGVGRLLPDVAALVASGQLCEPSRYYLWQPARAKDDANVPIGVTRYRKVLALINLLEESAAYLDRSKAELVFIQDGRFDVSVRYAATDLVDPLGDAIDKLFELFGDKLHRDQKLAMLANAVQRTTERVEPRVRFVELLRHLDDVIQQVTESYRLFCSNFSYEKIKNDIQDAHIEFTAKIHKTFSDIQNQLLAVPVATVIVATQMKQAHGHDGQFWINTGVLIGSAIFVVLFCLLVLNQWHTLTVIADEIKRRADTIATDHGSIADLFNDTFRKLRHRIAIQRSIIIAVLMIVMLGFLATGTVYDHLIREPLPASKGVKVINHQVRPDIPKNR